MSRGRLVPPNLDDRTWQDLVNEAKALIPKYAPEWTDHNPSDLGITLIELFAWLVEGMIYRLNRVPEKNYVEFLNLLGITRDPATPASTWLTYTAKGESPLEVPKGNQVSTKQAAAAEAIVFETDQPLTVLPEINLTKALSIKGDPVACYENSTGELVDTPLSGKYIDTSPPEPTLMILLGFDKPTTEEIRLHLRFSKPIPATDGAEVSWHYSQGDVGPDNWPGIQGETEGTVEDGSNAFQRNGIVALRVPEDWTGQDPSKDWPNVPAAPHTEEVRKALFWIGIRLKGGTQFALEHILFNSVPATNALTITEAEDLGTSTGEPFQFFELQNHPLFKRSGRRDPYDHLIVEVDGSQWERVEDLQEGPVNAYRLDPVTGTIYLGDHHPVLRPQGHGTIPEEGAKIRAVTYRYVAGGSQGNVPPATVLVRRTPIEGIVSVTNRMSARGGSDEEPMDETKRRAPEVLRNRYRAVTVEDYEYLAREASTDVKKVRALAARLFSRFDRHPGEDKEGEPWTYGGLNRTMARDTGHVYVIIVPDAPPDNPTPMPSEELLLEVADFLEVRRLITAAPHVTGPRYLPINVDVEIKIWESARAEGLITNSQQVKDDVEAKIAAFLHPLHGGQDGDGWEVGQDLTLSGLFDFIQPDAEVGFISRIEIQAGTPLYEPPDRPYDRKPGVWVQVADYELICNGEHEIKVEILK